MTEEEKILKSVLEFVNVQEITEIKVSSETVEPDRCVTTLDFIKESQPLNYDLHELNKTEGGAYEVGDCIYERPTIETLEQQLSICKEALEEIKNSKLEDFSALISCHFTLWNIAEKTLKKLDNLPNKA